MKLSQISIKPIIDSLRIEDIDDDIYFSKKFSNYISNSRLSKINPEQDGSPTEFFINWGKNKLNTTSLSFGTNLHTLVLQPESFFLTDIDRPTAKMGDMADYIYKKKHGVDVTNDDIIAASQAVDYYKNSMTDNKIQKVYTDCTKYWRERTLFEDKNTDSRIPIYTDKKSRDKIASCLISLKKNKDIQNLLTPESLLNDVKVGNEIAILLDVLVEAPEHDPFILKLKAKLDNYSIDITNNTLIVNDLKTTSDLVNNFSKEALIKYHYYREMAEYCWLLSLVSKKLYNMEKPTIKSNFLVIETMPHYSTKVVPMTQALFSKGFKEFTHLLKLVAFYCMHGYEGFGIKPET